MWGWGSIIEPLLGKQRAPGFIPGITSEKDQWVGNVRNLCLRTQTAAATLCRLCWFEWSSGLIQYKAAAHVYESMWLSPCPLGTLWKRHAFPSLLVPSHLKKVRNLLASKGSSLDLSVSSSACTLLDISCHSYIYKLVEEIQSFFFVFLFL